MTSPSERDDASLLVHAYLDGELDPAHALEVERRLASDPTLAAERDRIAALRDAIGALPREMPSPDLVRRIEAMTAATPPAATHAATRLATHPSWHASWRALAASMLVAAFLGSGATWLALRPGAVETTADLVLANHLRALMAPQPFDVASSDRHTVKPWFNGRVPEAPRVVDLAGEGFPLVGGRVDVIGRVPVPTLVYKRRQHLISLSALPPQAAAALAAGPHTIAGFNTLSWTDGGVTYWAVSDVAADDLAAFEKAFREAKS